MNEKHLKHLRKYAAIAGAERARLCALRRISKTCPNCKKAFSIPPCDVLRGRVYCSNKCRYAHKTGDRGANAGGGAALRGPKNPNWAGGVTSERHTLHMRDERVHQWRRRVLSRDGYRCQRCGIGRRGRLVAHHVKGWKQFPDSRFDVSNGLCLCWACHIWVHSKKNANRLFLY